MSRSNEHDTGPSGGPRGAAAGTVAGAGFLATAVAFGPARAGFGLFLPVFREAFSLGTATAGLIASATFGGFLAALAFAGLMAQRVAPCTVLVAGGLIGAVGMGLVAVSWNAATLGVGVALAGACAGLSWSPYNAVVSARVPPERRGVVLSVISTGTTAGIAAAGVLALAVLLHDLGWRWCWAGFAGAGLAAAVVNACVIDRRAGTGSPLAAETPARPGPHRLRHVAHEVAVPLLVTALSFGLANAAWLTFAVDHVASAGGLEPFRARVSGPLLFLAYGVGGLIGLRTRQLEGRLGLPALLRAVFLCTSASLALVALMPGSWPAALGSAALQGACVMTISAVFSFWSVRLFPALPSAGFTVVLLIYAAGNALGPAIAGAAAEPLGLGASLLGCGVLALVTAAALPRRLPGDDRRATA